MTAQQIELLRHGDTRLRSNSQRLTDQNGTLKRMKYALACSAVALGMPVCAFADSAQFDIAAQPLALALKSFATQAHMQVLYASSVVQNQRASGVHGNLEKHDALTQLLRDTGLQAVYTSDDAATIVAVASPASRQKQPANRGSAAHSDPPAADSGSAPTSGSPETLQVILVTAEKRQEPLQTVPVPVSVMPAATLAKQSQFRIQDYASQVPGLTVTSNEFNGASTVAIRGIISGDNANPTVGAMIDDVSIGSSTSIGGGFIVSDLDPSDLSDIEVLRGPQGTLYGASSMGGLVKYVTADPSTRALTGDVRAGTYAVYAGGSPGYDFSGAINVPLSDTWAMRGSVSTREDPGYITDVQYGRQSDVNKTKDYGAHLATSWRPSDQFSLKLNAFYQQNKIFGSSYITAAPGVGELQQSFLPDTGVVERKFGALMAVITAKLGIFDLTSDSAFTVTRLQDFLDYTGSTGAITYAVLGTPYSINTDDSTTRKASQEVRLSTHIGSHIDWLIGGFFTHEFSPYIVQGLGADPAGNIIGLANHADFSSIYQEFAGFTDLTYHFTSKFDVQVGGRASQILQTYQEHDIGPQDAYLGIPYVYAEHAIHAHAFTYLITPRLRVTPNLMVYARVASGYRPGGINPTVEGSVPREFKPDTTVNYEVGLKGDFFDRRLSLDGSLFYINWQDIQLALTDPATGNVYFTSGSGAKSEGVELAAAVVPVNGLKLSGWFTYDNAVLTKDMPPNSTAYGVAGDRLPYSSRVSANASGDYEFPLGALTGSFGATASYVGERVGTFVAALPGVLPQRQPFPAYTEIDLRSALNGDLWSLELYANNVADRRGILGGGAGTLTPTGFELIQPRTIGLSLSRKFE
jgi:outer membrane receptor protein involved in Fe transport